MSACKEPRRTMNLRIPGSTNVKLWLGLLIVPCWPCWVVARGQTRFRLPFVVLTQYRRPEMTYRLPSVMSENQGSSSPQIEMTFWLPRSDAWSNFTRPERRNGTWFYSALYHPILILFANKSENDQFYLPQIKLIIFIWRIFAFERTVLLKYLKI